MLPLAKIDFFTASEGNNGDFYIRITTNHIYGPKEAGVWPAGVSLVGPAGADSPLTYNPGTKKMLYNGSPDVDTIYVVRDIEGNVVGFEDKDGEALVNYEFTWAEFITKDPTDYPAGTCVQITDRHMDSRGTGQVRFVAGSSWVLNSLFIYYANKSDAPSAASWPGLRIWAGDCGGKYKSNGSIYVLDQESIVLGRSSARTKAAICPLATWAITASVDNGNGTFTLQGSNAHGLTAAQTTTGGLETYLSILSGTGWTPGLRLITDVATNPNHITISAAFGASTNVPTVARPDTFVQLEAITTPPLDIYSRIEIDAVWGATGTGTHSAYPIAMFDNSSAYGMPTASSSCLHMYGSQMAGFGSGVCYVRPNHDIGMLNVGATNSQKAIYPALNPIQGGTPTASPLGTSAIDSSVAKTIKLGSGSTVANQRFWIEHYVVKHLGA